MGGAANPHCKGQVHKWEENLGHFCYQFITSPFTFLLQRIPVPQPFSLITHKYLSGLNLDVTSGKLS